VKIKRTQVAAVLAFVIGAMAVFAGGRVLLGILPNYYVIGWLPIYNFVMGVITVGVTAVFIWRNNRYARPAAVITLAAHGLVLLTLLTAYRAVVAPDSLVAMTVRLVVWVMILTLLFWRQR
jgi:hypothetical protein